MRGKILPLLLIGLSIFSMILVNKAKSEEIPFVPSAGDFEGLLYYDVTAPKQVKVGETFSVTFQIKATAFDLHIDTVEVKLHNGFEFWEDSWKDMDIRVGATYQKTATFRAESEGTVYGFIRAHGFNRIEFPEQRHNGGSWFYVTQIHSKTYDELESEYNSLNQSYITLQKNYDSLRSSMYIFAITTIVFIATTIYFARRKSKTT